MQEYILKNPKSFNLEHIFECGQCFRWNKQEDGSYIGVFKGNVMNVQKQENTVIFKGICNGDIKEIVEEVINNNFVICLFFKIKTNNLITIVKAETTSVTHFEENSIMIVIISSRHLNLHHFLIFRNFLVLILFKVFNQ